MFKRISGKKFFPLIIFVVVLITTLLFLCQVLPWQKIGLFHKNARSTVYKLKLSDPIEPLLPKHLYKITQIADTNGFPKEYHLTLNTGICLEGVCKKIDVDLYWDLLGRFLRLKCKTNAPLTKNEHVLFSDNDYAKLDEILKDRNSLLKNYNPFFDKEHKTQVNVDATTQATPISIQNAVVKDAAYTSWALWHWVNGEITDKLLDLTKQSCNAPFLQNCLLSNDRGLVKFALLFILENEPKNLQFKDAAFYILDNSGQANCELALNYLKNAVTDPNDLNSKFVELLGVNGGSNRLILNYFLTKPNLTTSTMEQLASRLNQLSYHDVISILKLLKLRQCNTEKIKNGVSELLKSNDPFIVDHARQFLDPQNVMK